MKLKLPDSVASSQDVTALQLELRDYARWFTHESIKQRTHASHKSDEPILSLACKELLATQRGKKELDRSSLDNLIKELEQYNRNASVITLTLAAPATGSVKLALVKWCRANIAPDVLINFQFNATILGGMVVRYGSHVFDWSFRRKILASRGNFPEVLRRV
ncbi:MAG TPA: F0F1 ATP synthase subunit delta [Candidatus Saccharimonadales bacterium]|nr:F0F1 ATP synthase subunit delta [Candidatus Saccharimonadales bacterium]